MREFPDSTMLFAENLSLASRFQQIPGDPALKVLGMCKDKIDLTGAL